MHIGMDSHILWDTQMCIKSLEQTEIQDKVCSKCYALVSLTQGFRLEGNMKGGSLQDTEEQLLGTIDNIGQDAPMNCFDIRQLHMFIHIMKHLRDISSASFWRRNADQRYSTSQACRKSPPAIPSIFSSKLSNGRWCG